MRPKKSGELFICPPILSSLHVLNHTTGKLYQEMSPYGYGSQGSLLPPFQISPRALSVP